MTIFRIYTKKPHFTSLGVLTQLWKHKKAGRVKIKKEAFGEFPDGTMVRTQSFHCCGPSSIPGWGTKIPQAMLQIQKMKRIFFFLRDNLFMGDGSTPISSLEKWGCQGSQGLVGTLRLKAQWRGIRFQAQGTRGEAGKWLWPWHRGGLPPSGNSNCTFPSSGGLQGSRKVSHRSWQTLLWKKLPGAIIYACWVI